MQSRLTLGLPRVGMINKALGDRVVAVTCTNLPHLVSSSSRLSSALPRAVSARRSDTSGGSTRATWERSVLPACKKRVAT